MTQKRYWPDPTDDEGKAAKRPRGRPRNVREPKETNLFASLLAHERWDKHEPWQRQVIMDRVRRYRWPQRRQRAG